MTKQKTVKTLFPTRVTLATTDDYPDVMKLYRNFLLPSQAQYYRSSRFAYGFVEPLTEEEFDSFSTHERDFMLLHRNQEGIVDMLFAVHMSHELGFREGDIVDGVPFRVQWNQSQEDQHIRKIKETYHDDNQVVTFGPVIRHPESSRITFSKIFKALDIMMLERAPGTQTAFGGIFLNPPNREAIEFHRNLGSIPVCTTYHPYAWNVENYLGLLYALDLNALRKKLLRACS